MKTASSQPLKNRPRPPRICLAQMDVAPGDPARNTDAMLRIMDDVRRDADLVIFPEMAVPGYLLGDTWEQAAFLRECVECGRRIMQAARNLTVIFGNVAVDPDRRNEDGRARKYNALFVAADGRFHGPAGGPHDFVIKTLMPNYREFDDSRHFHDLRKLAMENNVAPATLLKPVEVKGLRLACLLCEDAWDHDYGLAPLEHLRRHAPDFYINCSCSPFTRGKNSKRQRLFTEQSARLDRPLIYVNAVGLQNNGKTVYVFDGCSCVYDGGQIARQLPAFEAGVAIYNPLDRHPSDTHCLTAPRDDMADIHAALREGARRFLSLCATDRVVVGLSGGIDSAVTAALYREILPPDNLLAVNMPSRHNSSLTINLARALAANLDCLYAEVPIEDAVELTITRLDGLRPAAADGTRTRTLRLSDGIKENIQARDRSARVLAALAAAFGGVFTCNANKSEATAGYTTLYGDLGGFFALLGDLWKGDIYRLAEYLNRTVYQREVIPAGCLDIRPSAELSAAQSVEAGLGDPLTYPYHDRLFAAWMEWWHRVTPEEVLEWYVAGCLEERLGYAGRVADIFPDAAAFTADLEYWWRRFQGLGLAKRIQAPPIMAVTRRAYGFDLRESQNPPWFSLRYREIKKGLGLA